MLKKFNPKAFLNLKELSTQEDLSIKGGKNKRKEKQKRKEKSW